MTLAPRNVLVYVWLFLVAATLFSWWAASSSDGGGLRVDLPITISVLLMSFVKVRLVIQHFMEVRLGPRWLRLCCDGWLVAVIGMVFGLSWPGL